MKIITFILLLFLLAGCNNSKRNSVEQKQIVENVNPLEEAFKEIKILKDSCDKILLTDTKVWSVLNDQVYNFIQKDVVKNRIIQEKSRTYFDKLALLCSERITMKVEVKYENSIYKYLIHTHEGIIPISAELTYDSQYDKLTVNWIDNGRIVQSDGEIHYNTEGWKIELVQKKNEFGEIVNTHYGAEYVIRNGEDKPWDRDKFVTVVFTNAIILWTNDLGNLSDINAILIKDHDSGEIYNIQYDERYHDDSSRDDHDIRVVLTGSNMMNFMNLTSRLTNFSILIKSNYDDSVLISKPENFNNIADVYQQIIVNNQKLRENENK